MGAHDVKIQDVEMTEQLGGRENEGRENTRRGNAKTSSNPNSQEIYETHTARVIVV